jgi:hypothetical protein
MFEIKRNVREEIDAQRVIACQGNRWLILLPWPVVGSRSMAFLVGRWMTGLSAWWFRNRARKKAWRGTGVPGGRQLNGMAGCEAGARERVESGLAPHLSSIQGD